LACASLDRAFGDGIEQIAELVKVVVPITAEDMQALIHARPMRDKYARLLEQ